MRTFLVLSALLVALTVNAQTLRFRTLAGSTAGGGYADGAAPAARFASPSGVAVCGDEIFIADSGNHAIRRLSPDGTVITWAGALAEAGSANGERSRARFRYPSGIAADSQCNLFVAEKGNHSIRRISALGEVTTFAGHPGTSGAQDGTGTSARFNAPQDVAVDTDGSVWVSDTGNNSVRRITTDGRVRTLATRLSMPLGITVDPSGNAVVADYLNRAVTVVTREGTTSRLASGSSLFVSDVAYGGDGRLYLTNYSDSVVQRIESNGTLAIVSGTSARSGSRDGVGADARFDHPRAIAPDASGGFIVVDEFSGVVRRVASDFRVTTIAATPVPESAHLDGVGADVRFEGPFDIDVDNNGITWAADSTTIRRVERDGTTTTIAGTPGQSEYRDGNRTEARFRFASRIAVEPAGTLVVIDGNTVRRVTMAGDVTTIAGSTTQTGNRNGIGRDALFNFLTSIAAAPDGTIYVADVFNRAIRRIVGDNVTTLATDNDSFTPPMGGIDVGPDGNVYLWNENAPAVFRVTPAGVITTVAAAPALNILMNGLAVAPDGTIYVGGFRYHSIYRLVPGSTTLELFAGDDLAIGNQNGAPLEARFRSPTGLDVAPDGRLFVRDSNRAIRFASLGDPPEIRSFTATPATIRAGESATLSWSVSAGTVTIEPSVGSVSTVGSVTVRPLATTTYTLIASSQAGEARRTVSVLVAGPRRRGARPSGGQ